MDQQIFNGLVAGRQQFRAGDVGTAVTTWKKALRVAYESQRHAMGFVLSKNLADAMLELSQEDATRELVQEAIGYYDYALQLVEACGLREKATFGRTLDATVVYIRRRRRRAQRLLLEPKLIHHDKPKETPSVVVSASEEEKIQDDGEENEREIEDESGIICTTCGQVGTEENPVIVDEADGCSYCQKCFDEFYAPVDENLHGTALANGTDYSNQEISHVGTARSDASGKREEDFGGDDKAAAQEPPPNESQVEVAEAFRQESPQVVATKEDDSLSEFQSLQPQCNEHHTTLGGVAMTTIQPAPEPTQVTKQVYSIGQLKSLKSHSTNLICPPEVSQSPVSLRNTNGGSGHTSSSKQKEHGSKRAPIRKSTPSTSAAPPTASLLPTLAACDTLANAMEAYPSPMEVATSFFDLDPHAETSFVSQVELFSKIAR